MPLFDYICTRCRHSFETIVSSAANSDAPVCPKCAHPETERQIVRFRVGGRGDLRESTEFHGCHPAEETHHHHAGCGHGGSSDSK